MATVPTVIKRVVKFKMTMVKDVVLHCLDPIRSQIYSYGTKQLVEDGTGLSTTVPSVLRTAPIDASYEVRNAALLANELV